MYRAFYFLRFSYLGFLCKTVRPEATFGHFGVRIDANPPSSCSEFQNVRNTLYCFSTCLMNLPSLNMFSHDDVDLRCVCCDESPGNGSSMSGTQWKTYVPAFCPSGYTKLQYYDLNLCLKYVPTLTRYPDAVVNCEKDGGDLIRIDTTAKYDIFKNVAGIYAVNETIHIWVQGVKENGQWEFHDGSPIPDVCSLSQSNKTEEIHMRSISDRDFKCVDAAAAVHYCYMCEKINF
ncbi:uncharacterized protein LOC134243186 [Saccostrea cucullata]|uniref:uncharacterized protein LOC134243186 n=1 Tax=Saccostrea cuccullata TaxID=36930 RepID=UPI002ED581AB